MFLLGACAAAVVFGAWRAELLMRERMRIVRAQMEHAMAMRERELALEEARRAASLEPEDVPVDLRLRYERETEPWAREQMRALIRELHGQCKNWDGVRQALGQLDAQAAHLDRGWSQTTVLS